MVRRVLRAGIVAVTLMLSMMGLIVVTAPPSAAVGCYGAGCDNAGPKGNGCFADQRVIASGGDNYTRLYYSRACHAFWAWSKNGRLYSGSEVHLEMQALESKGGSIYQWVHKRRLIIAKAPTQSSPGAEWTNALGARNSNYRFRALWVDDVYGGLVATPWARGGTR